MKTSRLTGEAATQRALKMSIRRQRQKDRRPTDTRVRQTRAHDTKGDRVNDILNTRRLLRGAPFPYSHMNFLAQKKQSVRERLRAGAA